MEPSVLPAPTMVCSSSIKRMMRPSEEDLLQHGLEALLELAPVLGPGNERPEIQGEDGLVL